MRITPAPPSIPGCHLPVFVALGGKNGNQPGGYRARLLPHAALSAWSSQFSGLRSPDTRIVGIGLKSRINRAGRDAFRRYSSTAMDLRASDGDGFAPNYCLGVLALKCMVHAMLIA